MPFYVAQVVGTGASRQDPFRPDGVDSLPAGTTWGSIDLRPTFSRFLLYSAVAVPAAGPTLIGELADNLTPAQLTFLANRFPGVDLSSVVTVKDAIKAIVLPRLWRDSQGRRQIWFANVLVHEDVA